VRCACSSSDRGGRVVQLAFFQAYPMKRVMGLLSPWRTRRGLGTDGSWV
jgi:hypothetical protein